MIEPKTSHLSNLETWKRWKNSKDPEAKKLLIEQYLSLVDYVTNRMSAGLPKNVAREDLVSHGILGLIDAVDKFDYERGLQFETYASWRIRGAIIDNLRQGDWVPRSLREKAKKLDEAYQILEQKYLRSITDQEVCRYLNISEQELQHIVQDLAVTSVCSLEDPIKEEDSETRMSLLVDESAYNPERKVHEVHLKTTLQKGLERLTEKERTVVTLLYYEDLSLSEIAEVMSLSPSRISQLHSKALQKLKGELKEQKNLLLRQE